MDCLIGRMRDIDPELMASVFSDRNAQFVGRLGWSLRVSPTGHEVDEYDTDDTTYLIVREGRRHLGSCRVRPVSGGTMIQDHFGSEFPLAGPFLEGQRGNLWEVTRFCRSPSISPARSAKVLATLADAMETFRTTHRVTGLVAVIYPEIGRILHKLGVMYLRIGVARLDGRPVEMICITNRMTQTKPAPVRVLPPLAA